MTQAFRSTIACLGLLASLSACGSYDLVEPSRHNIAEHYSVTTPIEWNRSVTSQGQSWTANGPYLDLVSFFAGLQDGDTLLPSSDTAAAPPRFKRGMSEEDIMGMVVDSLIHEGFRMVKGGNLRPASFGSLRGFRFDIVYRSKDGLAYAGNVIGAKDGGELHMIIYTAAREHYYLTYRRHVERVFNSVRTPAS